MPVAGANPDLAANDFRLLRNCEQLSGKLSDGIETGIHRDFYQDNMLMNDERVWFVNLDLYTRGHPATDVGSFQAHLIELE